MKTIRRFITLAALTVLVGTTACSTMRPSDAARLQGAWVGTQFNGNDRGTFIVSGNTFEFRGSDPRVWYKGTFKLRNDTQPKQFIAHIADTGLPQYVGTDTIAIYKIEGDTLTIAADEPGTADAPTGFDAPGAACYVLVKQHP